MSTRVRLWPTALASLLLAGTALGQAASPAALDVAAASANKLSNGGFESALPAYWTPSGAGATWPVTVSRSATHSLGLSGAGAASWTMGEAVRNWTDFIGLHGPNGFQPGEVVVSAYVKAEGVNTAPTGDAGRFQLVFEFFDDAAQTSSILGGPVVIDLPQTSGTYDWTKVDNLSLGAISLPRKAVSVRITFRKGASATGTMYLDDLTISGANWPGTIHNGNVDAGQGWYYFTPDAEGQYPNGQTFVNGVTNAQAHTGTKSLIIRELKSDASEAVQISERVPVTPGKPVLVSYWVKTEGNTSPATIGTGDNNIGLTGLWYTNLTGGAAGYGEVGGVDIRLNGEYNPMVIPLVPRQADNGWTQYSFVLTPPTRGATEAPVVGMELRLRYWHAFTGTTYWDDVVIADVADVVGLLPNTLANGSFEAAKPAYWDASGAGATWATNEARSLNYSLGLSGAGAASWTMGEAVRNWTDGFGNANATVRVGGFVKAVGVNTAPTTDAGKFQLVFEFFSAPNGTNILGQPIVLDLPQTAASTTGWVQVNSDALGAIVFPSKATSARITFRKGATATGAMYLDDLFITGGGTIHNGNVDAGDQWYYYTPGAENPNNTTQQFVNSVSAEAAHSGARGLTIRRVGPANTTQGEAVHITQRVPATNGNPMLVSFWLRTTGVAADSVGRGDYNIGATGLWYTNLTGGAAGYGEVGGFDIRFNGEYNPAVIPNYKNDANGPWKQYAFVAYPPLRGATETPVVGMEVRLRYWHKFEGTAMFDDVSIVNLGGTALATGVDEEAQPETAARGLGLTNFPNPFGQGTTVGFRLGETARVTLEVYNVLGQRVARVLDGTVLTPGAHAVPFEGNGLPSGTYVYVLRAGDRTETRTMTVLR